MSEEDKRTRAMEALRATFRPEFLNRVDDIIMFRALALEDIRRIILIQIGLIVKRLDERKLTLELTDRAKDTIAEAGYSPVYGARPLKRALQKLLLDPLAMKILEGTFREGDTIRVDASETGEITMQKPETKKRRST
jgi:ATP-dependent Clp protease ATP-binding subunit ClpB